jgi:hypothetical protein
MNMTIDDIENYFKSLAESHVDIKNSATRKTFFGLTEEVSSAVKTTLATPYMKIEEIGGRYTGSPEALEKPISVRVKIMATAQPNEASKKAAFIQAASILDDIVLKLAYDSLEQHCPPGVQFTSLPLIRWGPKLKAITAIV